MPTGLHEARRLAALPPDAPATRAQEDRITGPHPHTLAALGLPAIASLAIFQVLFVWNDLLIGLTLASENQPIAPTIAQQLRRFGSNLDVIAPASFFSALIPLTIFAMFQRYFVQGLLAGSVK